MSLEHQALFIKDQGYSYQEDGFFQDRLSMMASEYLDIITKIVSDLLLRTHDFSPNFYDLGAGRGEVSLKLKQVLHDLIVFESDIFTQVIIDTALQHVVPEIIRFGADMRAAPLKASSISIGHSKDNLVHLDDEGKLIFFHEMARIIKPNGYLIVTTAEENVGYVNVRSGRKPLRSRDVKIENLNDYLKLALIPNKPQKVGKPNFQLQISKLIDLVNEMKDFQLISQQSWTPQDNDRDWYIEIKPRHILIFQRR
jgi:SAM-dependent methyltransferase